ncbi:MAG: dinitrogenase iron-molybdenum cofactor biosynthesis protein [Spirochaetes bacterium]|nr:MAG: dinitrogenase iron-molybdenum cofactor biosynthesis protein [Spirochaetota bacterium]
MKVAITSNGRNLEAEVDQRFGRCRYFLIVDTDSLEYEVIDNSNQAGGGAGIAAAQKVVNKNVDAVLTGNCGPNAYQVLSQAGIEVITGVSGKVRDAVERYKSKELKPSDGPNVSSHFGLG